MAGTRLIIVDDDTMLVEWFKLQLESVGYTTVGEYSTIDRSVINEIVKLEPDIVLMDVVLEGGLSGLEAAEILINEYRLPVITITGVDDEQTFQRAKQLGIYHYLVKPVKPRELQIAVELSLTLHQSNQKIKSLLGEKQMLAKSLSREIDRMSTFVMALSKVRDMVREVSINSLHEWRDIFHIYQRDMKQLTLSTSGAIGSFDAEGRLIEAVGCNTLHNCLLQHLYSHTKEDDITILGQGDLVESFACCGNESQVKSVLCQRISIKGSPPSFLCLANKKHGGEYNELDIEIAALYASEVEKIVARQQLLSSLVEKNFELEENEIRLINQHSILAKLMGGDMQSCGELRQEILDLTSIILHALNADQVTIWMFHKDSGFPDRYWFESSECQRPSFKGGLQQDDYPNGIHSSLFERVISVPDVSLSEELSPLMTSYYTPKNIRAAMYVPIWKEGVTVGVIAIEEIESLRQWNVDEQYFVTALSEIISNHMLQCERSQVQHELEQSLTQLQEAQQQLLQSEKMASIGQLAAGVAHEINNPVGYINSNIGSLKNYIKDLFEMIDAYRQHQPLLPEAVRQDITKKEQQLDLSYLRDDTEDLLSESLEGLSRVKKIVRDLKDFSHVDEAEWQVANLHEGIDSTLNIVWNELKYKADVVKAYGEITDVYCIPSQLNQVFMNMLVNAAHAIEERGIITISSGMGGDGWVWVKFTDTGKGISESNLNRIFDPFFTTKPVGEGTGLGLSLSFSIVEKHDGIIDIDSEEGVGTAFTIRLPIRRAEEESGFEKGESNYG